MERALHDCSRTKAIDDGISEFVRSRLMPKERVP
jgi:hypothetical protein